jgi:predicted transposase/invertase (TIGR01784 family)
MADKKAETLPVVIPIVIYHGPKKWEVDKRFTSLYLEVLVKYLTRSARSLPEKELNEAVTQLFEGGGDLMETIAEKWKKEGKKEGKEEGKKEEKLETAKRMLLNNFSVEQVINITGLTEKEVKALMN